MLALGCLLAAPNASSQEDVVAETFGETLDVVVVEVEAVVTDRDGRRVTGLSRDDFRLLVDGRETPIDYFTEVREGRQVPAASGGTLTDLATERPETPPEPTDTGEPVVTNHLVFVDDYFNNKTSRNIVLRTMSEQLAELPPQDRLAVVAFDGETIDVLTSWTDSRDRAQGALDDAEKRPGHLLQRAHERRLRKDPADYDPRSDVVVQQEELHRVLTAVQSALRMMPRPDGRRVLVLLGGSWPVGELAPETEELDDSPLRSLPTGYGREAEFDDVAMMRELIESANLLGYTVYPVDVPGLRARRNMVAQEAPATDPETGLAQAGTSPFTVELFRQNTLRVLAAGTGGRPLLYDQRTRVLEAVVADTRTYYSLGFTPTLQGDGASHDVELQVRNPALEVRARQGFRDLSRARDLDLLAASALRFAVPEGEGITIQDEGGLTVSVGDASRRARGTMEVPLTVDVPWGEVTLVPDHGAFVGRLEIRVGVRDREGAVSEMARVPIDLERAERPNPETVLRWETDVTLRRERHDLVVSLYDAVSGRVTTRRITVEP